MKLIVEFIVIWLCIFLVFRVGSISIQVNRLMKDYEPKFYIITEKGVKKYQWWFKHLCLYVGVSLCDQLPKIPAKYSIILFKKDEPPRLYYNKNFCPAVDIQKFDGGLYIAYPDTPEAMTGYVNIYVAGIDTMIRQRYDISKGIQPIDVVNRVVITKTE